MNFDSGINILGNLYDVFSVQSSRRLLAAIDNYE